MASASPPAPSRLAGNPSAPQPLLHTASAHAAARLWEQQAVAAALRGRAVGFAAAWCAGALVAVRLGSALRRVARAVQGEGPWGWGRG
eukprot:scaffold80496_cov29-Tisochrysis_lutea.AAC.1